MGRAPCCEKIGIKRGRWTAEEDQILSNYIQTNGEGSWRSLPKNAGLKRCGKSCRLRWINYLRADLKRGNITPEEEELVVKLHSTLGNRWSLIASYLPGRTDNEIKNYWNSHLSRKLHSFIRKPLISTAVPPPAATRPPAKRRPGRTSRSAMKPKTHNVKTRKTKKNTPIEQNDVVEKALAVSTTENVNEELMAMELSGGGDNVNINGGENGVLSFDDDFFDTCLMLDEPDVCHVFASDGFSEFTEMRDSVSNQGLSSGGITEEFNSSIQSCPSVESFLNYDHMVNETTSDELIDWDCVWQTGKNRNVWDEKEGPDSVVSWLLDGDDEAVIGKMNCESLGEPLDLDEENAMVAWLMS